MRIVDHHGNKIASMEAWADLHHRKHWREGRSAYSVADFILNRNGVSHLESRLSELSGCQTSIGLITPEKEVKFDGFRGRGRTHDLGIDAVTDSDKTLFVGLEAKVDERFGRTIQDELESAGKALLRNPRSKSVERIKALPGRFFPELGLGSMLDIRYQLVHGTVGTVAARQAGGQPYDCYVFYVLVFKTSLFDGGIAEENHRDYRRFISRVGGSDIYHPDVEARTITVDGKPLTCVYEYAELPV